MTNRAAPDTGSEAAEQPPATAGRVYVGNLKPKANEIHITEAFGRFGAITNVWVARKPPGFAFVAFERESDALRAVEAYDDAHPLAILGKRVKVQLAGEKTTAKAVTTSAAIITPNKSTSSYGKVDDVRDRGRERHSIRRGSRSRSRSRSRSIDHRRQRDRSSPRRQRSRDRSTQSRRRSPPRRRKLSDDSHRRRRRGRSRSSIERSSSRSRRSRSGSFTRSRSRSTSPARRHRRRS